MFPEERRRAIAAEIRDQGRVQVADLAQRLGVTEETIRRDLRWLESRGQALRTHGGALRGAGTIPPLVERAETHRGAKTAIAARAVQLIGSRQSILLDSGSTALALAQALKSQLSEEAGVSGASTALLHLVTNSLAVAAQLAGTPGLVINLCGGTLSAPELCLVGPEAVHTLRRYRADVGFVACAGFDLTRGMAVANPFEAEVKRAMLDISAERIVVADSSKLGRTAMVGVAALDCVDILLTDAGADTGLVAQLREAGIRVEIAE